MGSDDGLREHSVCLGTGKDSLTAWALDCEKFAKDGGRRRRWGYAFGQGSALRANSMRGHGHAEDEGEAND